MNNAICQSYQRSNTKQPLQPHPVPDLPWEELGIDFFHLDNTNHIMVVDYHSKFVEIKKLSSTNSESVTNSLTQIFRTHGLPSTIHSDNGPPFDSSSFREFIERYNMKHVTSSPLYPKSNGMVERAIQTVKSMLIKTKMSRGDLNMAVVEYNNTPKENHKTPSEMLMGRRLRTMIPTHKNILKPLYHTKETIDELKNIQSKQKMYYDRAAHKLRDLSENENVYMQKGIRQWVPGTVVKKDENPESYIVKTQDGVYRRNRIHIRPYKGKHESSNVENNVKKKLSSIKHDNVSEMEKGSKYTRIYVHPTRERRQPNKFKDYV